MKSYQELLNTNEWKYFRYEILKRDDFTCQICHKKGLQNKLFVPISSLDEVLDLFSEYRFDGKTLKDIINCEKKGECKAYYFKPSKFKNLFRPLIEKEPNVTSYQYQVEIFNYADTRLYCDHTPQGKIYFSRKPPFCTLMTHKDYDIQLLENIIKKGDSVLNSDINTAYFVIDYLGKTSNDEGGYIQVIDNENTQWVRIVTNELCIFIEIGGENRIPFPKLNVHHMFYYYGNTLPWGYYWKDLITLCEDCHRHLHAKDETPIYDINMRKINDELKTCDRCGGIGFLPQYNHVQNGICFKCRGTRKIFMK